MFEDDIYDRVNPDDRYFVMMAVGGWRIADHETTKQIEATFLKKEGAMIVCKLLNEQSAEIERLAGLVGTYELNAEGE